MFAAACPIASHIHRDADALAPCNLSHMQPPCCLVQATMLARSSRWFVSQPADALFSSGALCGRADGGACGAGARRSASSGSGARSAWPCSMARSQRSRPRWRASPAAAARSCSQTTTRSGGSRSVATTHATGLPPSKPCPSLWTLHDVKKCGELGSGGKVTERMGSNCRRKVSLPHC